LGLEVVSEDKGSALIWFVFLVALLCLIALTLAASVHQYLFARELTDFTEQFAVALKTRLQLQPSSNIVTLSSALLTEVTPKYSFRELQLKQLTLEAGETVRVLFCAKWVSPFSSVDATRTICELALAR
jgi:Flp pilus assembly protein TadG